jgi:hypothetical protein
MDKRATTTTRPSSTLTSRLVRLRGREGGEGGKEEENSPIILHLLSTHTFTQSFPPSLHFLAHTDLSPAFDWNIKQLFVFLVVEYESKKNVRSLPSLPACLPPCLPRPCPLLTTLFLPPSLLQVLSQVVVWDRIIERKEDSILDLEAEFLDYPLRDPAVELR